MIKRIRRSPLFWGAVVLFMAGVILAGVYLHYTSPATVRNLVLKHGATVLRGKLHVGDTRMQLFRGLQLYDVRVSVRDESDPDIAVSRVRCDWNPAAFLHGEIEPRRLVFVRPRVRLVVDREGINLNRLFVPDHESNRGGTPAQRRAKETSQYGRYFSEGIFVESGELIWTHPAIFGDDGPRVFSGMDVIMQRPSETLDRWDLSALVREPPLEGTRIEGWMDLAGGRERAVFRGVAEELDITPELLHALPAGLRRVLSRYALSGRVSLNVLLNVRREHPVNYTLELRLRNVDARLRASDLSVRSLDGRLRSTRRGSLATTCPASSGMAHSTGGPQAAAAGGAPAG